MTVNDVYIDENAIAHSLKLEKDFRDRDMWVFSVVLPSHFSDHYSSSVPSECKYCVEIEAYWYDNERGEWYCGDGAVEWYETEEEALSLI